MTNRPDFLESKTIDVEWGIEVRIVKPCNLYGCKIGDHSFIGPFVEIQNEACIGKNCRIQSHCFICSQVTIEDNCFVGHGVTFTNDKFSEGKPSPNPDEWLPTHVGEGVSIGSGSTILPVRIVKGCVVGAGSVVTKDLLKPGFYVGNPAHFLRKT